MINLIVATDLNSGIGYKGNLLYPIKADLKRFKELTTNGVVIMGRKTWDSLPKKPLPNRRNIVLSNSGTSIYEEDGNFLGYLDKNSFPTDFDGLIFSYRLGINRPLINNMKDVWVIGGEQIYNLFLPYVDRIYLTKIHSTFEADAFFKFPETGFEPIEPPVYIDNDTEIPYSFEVWGKI